MNKKRWIFPIILVLVCLLSGCMKKAGNKSPEVARVNDVSIYMDEMMYYIYEAELSGNENEEIYQGFFGESFWDSESPLGTTNREFAKQEVMEKAFLYEIFYERAKEAGYTLTEEKKEQIKKDANDFFNSLTEEQKETMYADSKRFTEIFEKIELVNQYQKDFEESLSVDEAKAVSSIYEEDYEEYNVEYLFVPTTYYSPDETSDELLPYSKEEKQKSLEKIESYNIQLQNMDEKPESFQDILSENDEISEISEITFLKGDELLGEAFESEALKLKSGEYSSHVVEEEDGYYLIHMLNDASKEGYETALETAIAQAKQEAFEQAYEEIKKQYKTTVMDDIWGPIELGNLTYVKNAKEQVDFSEN